MVHFYFKAIHFFFFFFSDKDENVYTQQINNERSSITKRSVRSDKYKYKHITERTVETLVVADKNLYHKHGDQNITTYTLTLFNMVSLNEDFYL